MEVTLRKYIQGLAVVFPVLLLVSGFLQPATAEVLDTDAALADRVLGDDNAPLTIIEYSSLGCPHCMAFHRDTFPMVKKDYIDTGKVRLIFRDYPLGARAMAAAMIARCAPEERYFGMVNLFFLKQDEWSHAEDAMAALGKVAKFGGMTVSEARRLKAPEDENAKLKKLLAQIDASQSGSVKLELFVTFMALY